MNFKRLKTDISSMKYNISLQVIIPGLMFLYLKYIEICENASMQLKRENLYTLNSLLLRLININKIKN